MMPFCTATKSRQKRSLRSKITRGRAVVEVSHIQLDHERFLESFGSDLWSDEPTVKKQNAQEEPVYE